MKRSLALLLTLLMLVSALPLGVFAAEETEPVTESTTETTAYESQDYYWKLDFNKATVSDTATTVFDAGATDPAYNPYGFGLSGATNLTKAYVKKRAEGDNYVRVAYDIHQNSSWRGAQISVGKAGMSAAVFNTISFEMDFRWQGYAYTTAQHSFSKNSFPVVQVRRYENNPYTFIIAKENADENLDLYINKVDAANYITTVNKGAEKFTNIKVVYYDITQTYSIYIDNVLVADGRPTTGSDYRSSSYVTSTFDTYDMFNTSREQNPASNPYITFQILRTDYAAKTCVCGDKTKTIMPLQFDIDNLIVRNHDIKEGVTPYYESSFDTKFSGFVDGVGGNAYTWHKGNSQYVTNDGTFCVDKATYNGNTYINVEPGGRFNFKDPYQFVQDGNYVIDFKVRATSAKNVDDNGNVVGNALVRIYTGADTRPLVGVDHEGYIYLGGKKTTAKVVAHKDAEGNKINQDKWTHIAISVMVDKGGDNANVIEDFRKNKGDNSLRYQLALYVDGKLVAVNGDVARLEFSNDPVKDSAGKVSDYNRFRLIDDRYFTKVAITAEPDAAALTGFTQLSYTRDSGKIKYYHNASTGDIYQLEYDANGKFVPGEVKTTSDGLVSTGSLHVKITGSVRGDVIGFFNNNTSSATAGNLSGAIDDIKIYSGVIPLDYASTPVETTGVLAHLDFTKLNLSSNNNKEGNAMMNVKGGDVGVALIGSWSADRVKYEDGYSSYKMTANGDSFFDVFTQYMSGKIFSIKSTVRNFVPTSNNLFYRIRRQAAGKSSQTMDVLGARTDGKLQFTANNTKYILCDKNGTAYDVRGSEWITPEIIIDETGAVPTFTYLINGNVAYCLSTEASAGTVPTMAALIEGVYGAGSVNATAIDQRVRFFQTGSSARASYDIKEVKVEYTTLPEIVQQSMGYLEAEASSFSGGLYSAKIDVKNFNKKYDVPLLMPMRRVAINTPAYSFETLLVEGNTGYLYFKHDNGYKHYLVNEQRVRYSVKGSTAVTVGAIFDERGDKTLVTFLVDGEVAYYDNGEGLVSASNLYIGGDVVHALKNGAVQMLRFFDAGRGENTSFADTSTAVIEAVTTVPVAPEITWADELRVDFSEYESIDELLAAYNGQIEIVGNVTIENGLLKIPTGGKIKWVDYNGNLTSYIDYDRGAVNGQYLNGFAIEFVGNTNASSANSRGLIQLDRGSIDNGELVNSVVSDTLVFVNSGTFLLTGNTVQNYPLNPVGSDKFNSFAAVYTTQDNEVNVFTDGYLLGVARSTKFVDYKNYPTDPNDKVAKIAITGETELKELRIHRTSEREIAKEAGELFKLDADKMTIKYDGTTARWAKAGVMTGGLLTSTKYMTQETYTDAETGESFKYFKVQPSPALTGHNFSEIWLNGYLEDKVTVFEYDFRFAPAAGHNNIVEMCSVRRAEDNSAEGLFDPLFNLTADSKYKVLDKYILCDAGGNPILASAENWNKLAIIYDANAGLVSYVLNGNIPYYTDGDTVKIAKDIQLPTPRHYRMDSAETRIRTLSMFTGSTHRVDLAKLDIYTVDGTANAGYVGSQIDTSANNIRIVAGTDMPYYGRVGFDIEAFDTNGNSLSGQAKTYNKNVVYSSIKETVNGVEQNVYPESYGYRYFYTATVNGVDTENAVILNVTPYTIINGVKYKSSTTTLHVDFTSKETAEWTLDKPSVEVKPEGTNANGNFSATDIVTYTNDGALEFNGLDAKFGFAAELDGGVVSVNLTNAFGEVAEKTVLDIYVDGVLTQEGLELPFGHHTLALASGLKGKHEFVIVKRSGGDFVCINNMSVCGTLTTPPAIAKQGVVEVVVEAPLSGADYGHVRVYVPTSDESGKYFVKYNFEYLNYGLDPKTTDTDAANDPTYSTGGGNTKWNCHTYRIIEADLCEKEGDSYKERFGLLQSGEISVAMKEAIGGKNAADFAGGFHGDENFVTLKFLADGEEIDTTIPGTYTGITTVEFIQESIIDRCNEPDTPLLAHNQHFLVDTNGLRINRHIEVLADNFAPHHSNGYTMMATVYRKGETTKALAPADVENAEKVAAAAETFNIKTLKVLNANGELADDTSTFDMRDKLYVFRSGDEASTQCAKDSASINRYAENTGDKGVYARVGYVISDASMQPKEVRVDVRLTHGDNKWYACIGSYQTSKNGDIVPKGEKWNLSTYYFVDYNTANIPAAE